MLIKQYESELQQYESIQQDLQAKAEQLIQLENYMRILQQQDSVLETFDTELFHLVVDKVEISNQLTFHFKDGTVVSIFFL